MLRTGLWTTCVLACLIWPARAHADAVLLLGEPYGAFGHLNPTGHAAVYLTRVCTASPTELRRCQPGETGVVVSRYNRVAGRDWVAVPVMPFFYAVERADEVPSRADARDVAALRDAYRRAHLRELVPDDPGGAMPKGNWTQLVGSAYDRRFVAFTVPTSEAQDDALIRELNSQDNAARFNLLFRNCADFARDVLNFYLPAATGPSAVADLGLTTPKQVARSLVRHADRRDDLDVSAFIVPQVPGSRRQSGNTRGILETLIKTKKYVIPLALVQPWVPAGMAVGYVATGRFNARRHAGTTLSPEDLERHALAAAGPHPGGPAAVRHLGGSISGYRPAH